LWSLSFDRGVFGLPGASRMSYDDVFGHIFYAAWHAITIHAVLHIVFWISGQMKHWAHAWWGPIHHI
jgi:hypothetical protein